MVREEMNIVDVERKMGLYRGGVLLSLAGIVPDNLPASQCVCTQRTSWQ